MTDLGNGAQTRAIIEQCFAAWQQEQGKQRASWPAWFGVVLGGLGIVFSAGMLSGDVSKANASVAKLEQRVDKVEAGTAVVNDRLARIETKLDLALEKR